MLCGLLSCVAWAPDPACPGLVAFGDGRGTVTLVGLPDLEAYARHMPVWHQNRLGLRQAVGAIKSRGKNIASSTKAAVGGALNEAKHLVKDVKETLGGVFSLFGR
mmetsp:Transcript_47029/g.106519  ORF Transcript_47029/g.106519 Transcript_47029/m.106519 type:complete len:105 (-) Transcript_47029:130-444(-)